MKDDLTIFSKVFTLSSIEQDIFTYLAEYGATKAVIIRKMLKHDRAGFYRAINNLVYKDLVVVTGAKRAQVISLQESNVLSRQLSRQKETIIQAQKSLSSLQNHMAQLRDNRYRQSNVQVVSGKNAYLQSMQTLLKGGGKILRDISPDSAALYKMASSQLAYENIVKIVKSERLKKKISIRILFDQKAKVIDSLGVSSKSDLKESRVYSGNLHLDCYLNTCGSRTLFYTQDATGSWGIIIKDELIAKLLNSLFDVLWDNSKPL